MKKFWKSNYFKWGFTAFLTIIASVCFCGLLFLSATFFEHLKGIFRILMPVIDGLVIAYISTPILNFTETKLIIPICKKCKMDVSTEKSFKIIRSIGIICTIGFIILLLYGFFSIIIPQLIQSIQSIIKQLPVYEQNLSAFIEKMLKDNPDLAATIDYWIDYYSADITNYVNQTIMPQMNQLVKSISMSLIYVLKSLYNLIIGFIISIYILASKEAFSGQSKKVLYALFEVPTANKCLHEFRFIHSTFIGFLGGKIIDSIIIGIICFIGTSVLNIPYAVLVSVIVGVTNIIPFFGPYIGAIPSALLILMVNPLKCLTFIIFVLILQQIDGNIIGPKILGNSTGLSGFWVIFAITFFGGLWGVLGMIVGVPLFAVIYAGIKAFIFSRLKAHDLKIDTDDYDNLDYINEENHEFIMHKEWYEK